MRVFGRLHGRAACASIDQTIPKPISVAYAPDQWPQLTARHSQIHEQRRQHDAHRCQLDDRQLATLRSHSPVRFREADQFCTSRLMLRIT